MNSDPHSASLGSAALSLVLTCEHGGNDIPPEYRPLFAQAGAVLQSHRGYDPGTLELAQYLAKSLGAPLHFSTTSRLLIELNRTLGHRQIFSEFTRTLPDVERENLINKFYRPYRDRVQQQVTSLAERGRVIHLSVHSFTPVMKGLTRQTDIGLLFDPSRELERKYCISWRTQLRTALPGWAIHFNRPYRGTSDGFTTALRKLLPGDRYAGIELEVNQKFPLGDRRKWSRLQNTLAETLKAVLAECSV